MGVGFVAVMWLVFGTIAAFVGRLILRRLAAVLTREVDGRRERLIRAAAAFPFVCLAWCAAVFIFQATINEKVFHRDPWIGDAWECPLPNGYALLMIDVPDVGWVYNPRTQSMTGGVGQQEDAIPAVRTLQVANRYIFGGIDSNFRDHFDLAHQVDSYFALDTMTGKRTDFATLDELRNAGTSLSVQLALEPIFRTYAKYRVTWFDMLAALLFVGPPLLGLALLGAWTLRERRATRELASHGS